VSTLLILLPVAGVVAVSVAGMQPRTANPHGSFKEECALCHGAEGWKPARVSPKFDHGKYGFQLEGAHAAAGCMGCHTSLEFSQARTQCQSCHEDPHRGEMGADCARCHGARSFVDRGPMVRAHQLTAFPLTGGHKTLECESCHPPVSQGRLQFVGVQADCQSCHMKDYQATTAPDHETGGFPLTCQTCHSTVTWTSARFDHATTRFALTGTHRTTACASCHVGGLYRGTPTECASCHMDDYQRATPNHPASGFQASACAGCHNTTSWEGGGFDHATTRFPLTGAHRAAACSNCHANGVFAGTPMDCASCHMADYQGATPNHASAGFPASACASCHNTTAWQGAVFDHATTRFPLTGAHRTADCSGCHGGGVYTGTPTDCASCHMTEYQNAVPNHASAGFAASACATCHTTTAWAGATFDHDSRFFPIYSGTHRNRWSDCAECHTNASNYAVFTCLSCHPHSDRAETDSHHQGRSGYSYDSDACYSCHPRGRAD
jgi:hypothetical protein